MAFPEAQRRFLISRCMPTADVLDQRRNCPPANPSCEFAPFGGSLGVVDLAACRTEFCDWLSDGFFGSRWIGQSVRRVAPSVAPRPQQAGLRTNIRFKFQAVVTRLHSPCTFSSPRREN